MIEAFREALQEGVQEGWVTCRYRLGINYPVKPETVWFDWKTTQAFVRARPKSLLLGARAHPVMEVRKWPEDNTISWTSVTDHVYYVQFDPTVAPVWFGHTLLGDANVHR